jgi:hypothetical protein
MACDIAAYNPVVSYITRTAIMTFGWQQFFKKYMTFLQYFVCIM